MVLVLFVVMLWSMWCALVRCVVQVVCFLDMWCALLLVLFVVVMWTVWYGVAWFGVFFVLGGGIMCSL